MLQHGVDAEGEQRHQGHGEAEVEGVHDAAVLPGGAVDAEYEVGEEIGYGDDGDGPEEPAPGLSGDVAVELEEQARCVARP